MAAQEPDGLEVDYKIMTTTEFFEKFPHMFSLPERPQCVHCWMSSMYLGNEDGLFLVEYHGETCPLFERNNLKTKILERNWPHPTDK